MTDLFNTPAPTATLSDCEQYRYLLTRTWDRARPYVLWVMLNPSTADASEDDPTIKRCKQFARDWGYGGIRVVNLFALRATDPQELTIADDPVGPENDLTITQQLGALTRGSILVCAWGNHGTLYRRHIVVVNLIKAAGVMPFCLRKSKSGMPVHPLYLPGQLRPQPFRSKNCGTF